MRRLILLGLLVLLVPGMCFAGAGSYFRSACDDVGNVYLSYVKGSNLEYLPGDIYIYNVKEREEIRVPDAVSFRGFLITGLAVGNGKVAVAWTDDNTKIRFIEYTMAAGTWGEAETIMQSPGIGTNRCSIAINAAGTMVVASKVDKLAARLRGPHGNWGAESTVFPNISTSEPTYPTLHVWDANRFIVSYTCTCRAGTSVAAKSIGVSYWDGSWKKFSTNDWGQSSPFNIPGSPFMCHSTGMGDNIYVAWIDWCDEPSGYCRLGFGQLLNGSWSDMVMENESHVVAGDKSPGVMVAADTSNNVIVAYPNKNSTYVRIKQDGNWGPAVHKGAGQDIAVVYSPADAAFFLCYNSGSFKVEKVDLQQPVPTPTPVVTPTEVSKWDMFEIVLTTTKAYSNPITTQLFGWFAEPGSALPSGECNGDCHKANGFYLGKDGNNHRYMVRFRPDKEGEWHYSTFSADQNNDLRVTNRSFKCNMARGNNHGPLLRQGEFLFHADGSDPMWLGGTSFGLVRSGSYLAYLEEYIDKGVNEFRIGLNITWGRGEEVGGLSGCGTDGNANGCWLNTFMWNFPPYPADVSHDWTQLNLAYFQKLDEIMHYLLQRGAYAEIVLYDSSMKYVFGPKETSWEQGYFYTVDDPRQKFYLQYIADRIGPFPNKFWEACNELRHNAAGAWHREWPMAKAYVRWLGSHMKEIRPDTLFAYDAMWSDTRWTFHPTHMDMYQQYNEASWHAPLWGEEWCDIVNIHTKRDGGVWWWMGPAQMHFLRDAYNKPTNNDEPARAGWGAGATEDEVRKSAYLTTMAGNSKYTIHGLRDDSYCKGCIDDSSIGTWTPHYAKFFRSLDKFNFYPDWSLIEGAGQYTRSMHRNNVYVYYAQDAQGEFTLHTFNKMKYDLYAMDVRTGVVFYDTCVDEQDVPITLGSQVDFIAYLKPHIEISTPTPTPTSTLTPTPTLALTSTPSYIPTMTPTATPGGGGGGIGCPFHRSANAGSMNAGMGRTNADDLLQSVGMGMFILGLPLFVLHSIRKYRKRGHR